MRIYITKIFAIITILYQNIYMFFSSIGSTCGNVWMFHLVTDKEEINYEREFSIKMNSFIALIESAIENGFHFKSLDKLAEATSKDIFITFDDGFKEVYSVVSPLLQKYSVPYCVFVTAEFIDSPGYLSKEELLALSEDDLCTIGAHTLTHPRLKELRKDIAFREIQKSKVILEKLLENPVEYFAYPYGDFFSVSQRDKKLVKKSRFKYAFSTIPIPLNKRLIRKAIFIPRNNVNDDNCGKILYRSEH